MGEKQSHEEDEEQIGWGTLQMCDGCSWLVVGR